jgi:hypothetical protein
LGVIVLGWFFWPQFSPANTRSSSSSLNSVSTSTKDKQDVSVLSLFGTKKKLRCEIESAKAVIVDTKVSITYTEDKKQNRVVFDGDCLYRWTNGNGGGERSCGLKSYIPLASQFISQSSLQKVLPQSNELASACKDVSVVDSKVFEIPKTVLFKNKKLI